MVKTGIVWIGVICLLLSGLIAKADVVYVGSATGFSTADSSQFTFQISIPANTQLAVVGVTNRDARDTSWVRFDGYPNMTFVINSTSHPRADMDERAQLFYYLNPPAGTQTVRVQLTGNTRHKAAGCLLLNGINAAAMSSAVAKADENYYDNNPTPTLTFSGTEAPTGSMIVSVINNRGNGLSVAGGSQTERWNILTEYLLEVKSRHGGGTAPGSSSTGRSVSWSPSAGWPTKANWGMVAMVVPAMYYGITNVTPDTLSVNDGDPTNTIIGTLTATDPDNKPPYTWTLINDAGGRFSLSSSTALTIDVKIANAALIDYGQDTSHVIRVGVRNAEYPVVFEKDITINVVDTTPPVIQPATSSKSYARWGEFVPFSAEITDNTGIAGTPVMTLGGTPLVFSNQNGNIYTWGWNVPLGTPDGPVGVVTTAQDGAGNQTQRQTPDLVIIDNTPPTISALSVSHTYSKVGDTVTVGVDIVDFYGIANYPTVTFAGMDGGIPTFDGVRRYTWQIGITGDFPEGPADILVTAFDLAGNSSQGSGPAMLTIDKTPPVIGGFASNQQYARLNDIVTLQASVMDNYGLSGFPKMYLNGNLLNTPTASGNTYYWLVQITTAVQQGNAVIVVEATDYAGHVATASPASTILVVDYTPPNITQLTCTPSRAKGGTALVLTARVLDNYELAGTPVMNINYWPVPPPTQSGYVYTWNFVVPSSPPPTEGPAEIAILATDVAGNTYNMIDTSKLIYDPNPPVFSQAMASPAMVRLGQSSQISVNIYDISPLTGLPTLTVNGVAATHTGSEDLGGNVTKHMFSTTVTSATPEGDAALTFYAKDILNNERTASFSEVLLVDKTAPVISNISCSPSINRAGGTVTITFDAVDALTAVDGLPTVTVNGANATYRARYGNHYEYRYTIRSPQLDPNGPATIFISCRDTLGNTRSTTTTSVLIIDNSLPVITQLTMFPNAVRDGNTVTIGFRATDESGLSALPEVKINGKAASFVGAQGSAFEYRYTVRSNYDPEGYATLYIRVVDGVGNALVSESSGLLLVDYSPPTGTLSINNGALMTRSTAVELRMTADDGALGTGQIETSFSDDGVNWTTWESLATTRPWQLKPGQGYKTVFMRLKDRVGNISAVPITATIALKPNPLMVDRVGPEEIKGVRGLAVILEVTPRNVFGTIRSYEWFKDGQPIEGFGPVLAIENFEESDMGRYVCRVADDLETAESLPFEVVMSEEIAVPISTWIGIILIMIVITIMGGIASMKKKILPFTWVFVGLIVGIIVSGPVAAEVTVVYSARAEEPMDLSDQAMIDLALEYGSIEIWTKREDGTVRRQLARLGEPGVGNPGFTSFHREEFTFYKSKGITANKLKDGTEVYEIPLADEALLIYSENRSKGISEPSFEMKLIVEGNLILSERRYEEVVDGIPRPTLLRVDYPGGAMIQLFEFTDNPPAPLPPVYLRKEGVDDSEKSESYPKSWATKDGGDMQTREVQFVVPPQGIGSLGFDSGWVPGGSGPDPGGYIIQVRIRATAGYTYDAAVNGTFNLSIDDLLGLGPAAGSWGFYFGAEFFMKAAFDIPPIFGFDLPPFTVDIPYVPDFRLVTSDRDNFNSWLLEEKSTLRDEGGRTNVASVDLVSILITQGILPQLPSWVPLPQVGAALDIGAVANGSLECDNIALSDGTVFTLEGQQLPIYVPQSGYQAIAEYNEIGELNLGVKFYPYVFFRWFGFSFAWPTDFSDPDSLLSRLEWLPVSHRNFPFTNAEINFTGQPSTQPANDWFTQLFQPVIDTNNVSFKRVRFTPNLSNNFYSACIGDANAYRTNPAGGIPVTLGNDAFVQINLTDNKQVSLYGNKYGSFFIGSNGYITFNSGDTTKDESLQNHFNQPRISGLFLDLKPNEGGTISYKQLPNRVVVTYDQVRISNIITPQTASFQIEMFFDGRIVITWLQLDTYVGLIGLSRGGGVPENYQKSRFTNYPGCLTEIQPEYGIRVNFQPPEVLPYEPRWRVGTISWLPSGTYTSVPLGENWVYFNYIPIYWQAPETALTHVNTPDVFVNLTPVWTRTRGTVSVNTQPGIASWTVTDADGTVRSGTGSAVLQNIPTGMTTVTWLPLPTYMQPSPPTQTAMLYPNSTISFSGTYPPIIGEGQATLIVTLEPPSAVAAGAQWRVNGGAWLDSGTSVTIPDGNNTMEFKEIAGWAQPAAQTLFFHRNTTTTLSKGYGRHYGRVLIDPNPATAPWVLTDGDGVQRSGIGYTGLQNIPTGPALTVLWGEVAGYTPPTPNPTVFSLSRGEVKRVVGAYVPVIGEGEGIVRVTIYPPAAANAGAQWRLFGGEWRSSSGMAASPDGEQIILFNDLFGWAKPADMTVTVVRDVINDFNATYERLSGTIQVQVTPNTATYTITDSDGGTYSRMGNATLENIPSGQITLVWDAIEGYASPQPNPAVYMLDPGITLQISGEYIQEIVTADFTAFPLTGTPPLEVTFQDASHSTTKEIIAWRWYFGDGKTSAEKNPVHLYRDPGEYTVTLSVFTEGKMDVVSKHHYIVVTQGVPAAGLIGLAGAVIAMSLGGVSYLRRRKR